MTFTILLAITVAAQANAAADQAPLELERGIEVEILDRDIQRQHDTVLVQRGKLRTIQRLAQRGAASLSDVKRSTFDLQLHEAREIELNAFRALRVYERDVLKKTTPATESKAYALILEWVRAQEAVAEIEVSHRSFVLDLARALVQRNAARRIEVEDDDIAYRSAVAGLAVCRVREAQVLLEMASRNLEKPSDPADLKRLKSEYLTARVRAAEIQLETAQRRLEIARDRARLGLMPVAELPIFEKAATDASSALDREKKALEGQQAEPQPEPAKAV